MVKGNWLYSPSHLQRPAVYGRFACCYIPPIQLLLSGLPELIGKCDNSNIFRERNSTTSGNACLTYFYSDDKKCHSEHKHL